MIIIAVLYKAREKKKKKKKKNKETSSLLFLLNLWIVVGRAVKKGSNDKQSDTQSKQGWFNLQRKGSQILRGITTREFRTLRIYESRVLGIR